jgi:NCS1 family nucleobase:cation symporter-1
MYIDSVIGILFCDYWVVKRKRYDVPALYDPKGIYFYKVSIRSSSSDLCLH